MRFTEYGSFYSQLAGRYEELSSYPFATGGSAGRSVGGRELFCLNIGGRDRVLIMAGTHPLEYITSVFLCEWLFKLCEAIQKKKTFCGFDAERAFKKRGITVLLCHNPDGSEIAFKNGELSPAEHEAVQKICGGDPNIFNCNLNGVDLNHNFDAGWEQMRKMEIAAGINGPSPRRYGGSAPCSEPENAAVTALCEKYRFRQAMSVHSQGEEIYWKYGDSTPDYSEIMAHVLSISCGYRLAGQEGMASHGGFKDWFITRFNRPAFTIEIGKGTNPLPLSDLPAIYKKIARTLFIFCIM